MLTLDYVKEHIDEIEYDDFCDRRFTKRLCGFLSPDDWKEFGFKYTGEGEFKAKEWTEENIINQLKEDRD